MYPHALMWMLECILVKCNRGLTLPTLPLCVNETVNSIQPANAEMRTKK